MKSLHSLERNKKSALVLWSALLAASVALPAISLAQTKPGPPPAENAAFSEVWQRADMPVAQGRAQRSWLWGPKALTTKSEPLAESPGGSRQVQYYDKARMEVNNPAADPTSPGYVSNGLLVVEMISGRVQVGVNRFEQREPAAIPVAGDTPITAGPRANTPTYAALAKLASLESGQNPDTSRIGSTVNVVISPEGDLLKVAPPFPGNMLPKIKYYEPTTKHNIPDVFYDFMNQSGVVYENGQYKQGRVFDWVSAMGYPITEPYWTSVEIKGKTYPIIVQAFQRRVLTYNPANAPEWRVEMGNVGMQYHQWRYGTATPSKDPTMLSMRPVGAPDILTSGQYSAIHQPLYAAIADEKAWTDLWVRHTAELDMVTKVPPVDFKSEFVVAAFWGTQPDGCYTLKIESVSLKQGALQVVVNRARRSGGCTMVIVEPNDMVLVSRAGLPTGKLGVSFVEPGGKEIATGAVALP
ncbi:MAG: hypothetical protein ABIO92_06565 [Chloroflexia bacterium]